MPSFTTTLSWTVLMDDGEEVDCRIEVDCEYDRYQPATHEQPAEGGAILITECRIIESLDPDYPLAPQVIILSPSEDASLAEHIADHYLPE